MSTHIVNRLYDLINKDIDILRPNRFAVTIHKPGDSVRELVHTMIQSVNIPALTMSSMSIRRMGRGLKMPGTISFTDVTITLFDDSKSLIRNYFNKWIQEYTGNYDDNVYGSMKDYMNSTIEIKQLDRAFNDVSKYIFHNAFPVSISETDLTHETGDTLVTFSVIFNYSYYDYEKIEYMDTSEFAGVG